MSKRIVDMTSEELNSMPEKDYWTQMIKESEEETEYYRERLNEL